MAETATVYTDGASRGNPGPSAISFVLEIPGQISVEHAEVIPDTTNNDAEYQALLIALETAVKRGVRSLKVLSDSELMVKQMKGIYKVKNPTLQDLVRTAQDYVGAIGDVTFAHIPREKNKRADQLCNEVLDKNKPKVATASKATSTASKGPATVVSDQAVRDDALLCLMAAARSWAEHGPTIPPPVQVWDQLWSILEDNGVLKKVKAK